MQDNREKIEKFFTLIYKIKSDESIDKELVNQAIKLVDEDIAKATRRGVSALGFLLTKLNPIWEVTDDMVNSFCMTEHKREQQKKRNEIEKKRHNALVPLMEALLKKEADANIAIPLDRKYYEGCFYSDIRGVTPLHYAAILNNEALASLLIKYGAKKTLLSPNPVYGYKELMDGAHPFVYALRAGNVSLMKKLLPKDLTLTENQVECIIRAILDSPQVLLSSEVESIIDVLAKEFMPMLEKFYPHILFKLLAVISKKHYRLNWPYYRLITKFIKNKIEQKSFKHQTANGKTLLDTALEVPTLEYINAELIGLLINAGGKTKKNIDNILQYYNKIIRNYEKYMPKNKTKNLKDICELLKKEKENISVSKEDVKKAEGDVILEEESSSCISNKSSYFNKFSTDVVTIAKNTLSLKGLYRLDMADNIPGSVSSLIIEQPISTYRNDELFELIEKEKIHKITFKKSPQEVFGSLDDWLSTSSLSKICKAQQARKTPIDVVLDGFTIGNETQVLLTYIRWLKDKEKFQPLSEREYNQFARIILKKLTAKKVDSLLDLLKACYLFLYLAPEKLSAVNTLYFAKVVTTFNILISYGCCSPLIKFDKNANEEMKCYIRLLSKIFDRPLKYFKDEHIYALFIPYGDHMLPKMRNFVADYLCRQKFSSYGSIKKFSKWVKQSKPSRRLFEALLQRQQIWAYYISYDIDRLGKMIRELPGYRDILLASLLKNLQMYNELIGNSFSNLNKLRELCKESRKYSYLYEYKSFAEFNKAKETILLVDDAMSLADQCLAVTENMELKEIVRGIPKPIRDHYKMFDADLFFFLPNVWKTKEGSLGFAKLFVPKARKPKTQSPDIPNPNESNQKPPKPTPE